MVTSHQQPPPPMRTSPCGLLLFVILSCVVVVTAAEGVTPDVECRCDYEKHEGEVSFVCFDKHDKTFVEETKCPAISQERPCEATLFRSCSGQTNVSKLSLPPWTLFQFALVWN